jgi:ribonucleoside-diphosphate reductase alpha chain
MCLDLTNSHLRAIAPTVSNSKLAGGVSSGIEPLPANVYTEQSAKGTFIRKNLILEKVLRKVGINTKETWDKIIRDKGSVQGLDELDKWCYEGNELILLADAPDLSDPIPVKDVFKTFKEINQLELIKQAGIRQEFIDQAVSLNLTFPQEASPKWINQCHVEAHRQGIKTLYYMRTESVLRGDLAAQAMNPDCVSCEG